MNVANNSATITGGKVGAHRILADLFQDDPSFVRRSGTDSTWRIHDNILGQEREPSLACRIEGAPLVQEKQ